jgi:hypothetical protein
MFELMNGHGADWRVDPLQAVCHLVEMGLSHRRVIGNSGFDYGVNRPITYPTLTLPIH